MLFIDKSPDTFCPMGPWLVTRDEFDRDAAAMIVRVNGEEWSRGQARDMHHGFERMRIRGLSGARDEFHLDAIVQNLKTLALRT